jgi:hypothetical protein
MLNFQFQGNRKLRDEITSSRLNAILTELRRIRPVAGRGINLQQEPNGTRISALDSFVSGGGGGGAAGPKPWDLISRRDPESEPENPSYLVRVYPGTISNVLADNWDTEYTASEGIVYFGKAVVSTDGQDITGVTVAFDNQEPTFSSPAEFSTPATIEVLFGLFLDGKSYRTIGAGSPVYRPRPWLTQPANGSGPGELPYTIYYTLLP